MYAELLPNMKIITLPQELESARCRRNKTPKLPETTPEDDEEEMGTTVLSFFQGSQSMPMNISAERPSPAEERPLSFDAAKNGVHSTLAFHLAQPHSGTLQSNVIFVRQFWWAMWRCMGACLALPDSWPTWCYRWYWCCRLWLKPRECKITWFFLFFYYHC